MLCRVFSTNGTYFPGKKDEENGEITSKHHDEVALLELKLRKSNSKAALTRAINRYEEEMHTIRETVVRGINLNR